MMKRIKVSQEEGESLQSNVSGFIKDFRLCESGNNSNLIYPTYHIFLLYCQINHDLSFQHTHTHAHIYIYIYIVIHRQTISLYYKSSVWLDTRDASSWD